MPWAHIRQRIHTWCILLGSFPRPAALHQAQPNLVKDGVDSFRAPVIVSHQCRMVEDIHTEIVVNMWRALSWVMLEKRHGAGSRVARCRLCGSPGRPQVAADRPTGLGAASLWGRMRIARVEHPELNLPVPSFSTWFKRPWPSRGGYRPQKISYASGHQSRLIDCGISTRRNQLTAATGPALPARFVLDYQDLFLDFLIS